MGTKRRHRKRMALTAALTLVLAILLAACGDDDSGDSGDSGSDAGSGELSNVPGFDGETIKVGVITPLTGPVEVIGAPLTNGNQVWVDYYNEEMGGIAGQYPIELEIADSQYVPQTAVQQYNRMKDDVVMLGQLLGTPITTAVLPQLAGDNIVASPASLDSLWVREGQLAPLGGPYQVQAINGISHYVDSIGSADDVVCSMHSEDEYGQAGNAGLEFAAEELGFEIASTQTFLAGDEDFTAQIGELAGAECDVVWFTGLPTEAGTIFGTAAQAEFAPVWMANSPMWVDELLDSPLKDYLEATTYIVSEGPQWGDDSVQGMADMLDRIEEYSPKQDPDFYFTFGYNEMRLVTEILEAAVANGDLSRDGIKAAMEGLGTVSFDGLSGDYEYGPADERTPPRTSSVFKVKSGEPFGLEAAEVNFASDAAEAFSFDG